jgi:hypothetical protein
MLFWILEGVGFGIGLDTWGSKVLFTAFFEVRTHFHLTFRSHPLASRIRKLSFISSFPVMAEKLAKISFFSGPK